MSHISAKNSYKQFEERLNRFPQGVPPSKTLFEIMRVLVDEKEAGLLALLPIKPFSIKTAAQAWKMEPLQAEKTLELLARRGVLLDIEDKARRLFVLPPPMAGFFEFALMRTRGDIDQTLLSQLFHQYMNVEEDFIKELFFAGETRFGRVFVQEAVLSNENAVHVLDYERSTHVIKSATTVGVSLCYCRHKMEHLGKSCAAPMEICLSFNNVASALAKHGNSRLIEKSEALDLLQQAVEHNLVQCGENAREEVAFLCNCCGCCCEALLAAKKYGALHPVHTTNFLPQVNEESCTGCGRCVKLCPVQAMTLVAKETSANTGLPHKQVQIDETLCLGCGVCVRCCPKNLSLKSRPERVITPVNSVHRVVLMALERGTFAELVFDKHYLASHRAMASILGALLKLPPLKRLLATKQVKSHYLEWLLANVKAV